MTAWLDLPAGEGSLGAILRAAVHGQPPDVDGAVAAVRPPTGAVAAIVAFTGHHVIAADVPAAWVAERCPTWALEAPFGPGFVAALAERLAARAGTLDLVLVADGLPLVDLDLVPDDGAAAAARLAGAPNPRRETVMYRTSDGGGRLVLGRGLEDRLEAAIEVAPHARGRGLGRALARSARGLVGPAEHVFAQIAPGNVASLRAALAAGFRPVAAEILFFGGTTEPPRAAFRAASRP